MHALRPSADQACFLHLQFEKDASPEKKEAILQFRCVSVECNAGGEDKRGRGSKDIDSGCEAVERFR